MGSTNKYFVESDVLEVVLLGETWKFRPIDSIERNRIGRTCVDTLTGEVDGLTFGERILTKTLVEAPKGFITEYENVFKKPFDKKNINFATLPKMQATFFDVLIKAVMDANGIDEETKND